MPKRKTAHDPAQLELIAAPPPDPFLATATAQRPLLWSDVWAFIHLLGFAGDEYASLSGNIVDPNIYLAQPVWGDLVQCVPVWWSVGSNEGYYIWIETVEHSHHTVQGGVRRERICIKVWDATRALAAVASIATLINQRRGMGDGSLFCLTPPFVTAPGLAYPMSARHIRETADHITNPGVAYLFHSAELNERFMLRYDD